MSFLVHHIGGHLVLVGSGIGDISFWLFGVSLP